MHETEVSPASSITVNPPTGSVRVPASRAHSWWSHLLRWGTFAVLTVVGLGLLPGYRYHTGLDGISYLSIAQHYANGDLTAAINPYWSPMISWLTAPLIAVGLDAMVAGHIVMLGSAVVAMAGLRHLAAVLGVGQPWLALMELAAVPFLLAAAYFGIFADLLVAGLLLLTTATVAHPAFEHDRRHALRGGVLAGLAYLTKVYALPWFLAILVVVTAGRWWVCRDVTVSVSGQPLCDRARLLRQAAVAASVALGFVIAWSTVLSLQAGTLTFTTSASYNLEVVAPGSQGNPIRYGGLMAPPHDDAVSVWEDPSIMPVQAQGWDLASPRAALRGVRENVARNGPMMVHHLANQAGLTAVLALLGAVGLAILAPVELRPALVVGTAMAVYAAGYLFLWVEERYLWFIVLALVALAGAFLDLLSTRLWTWYQNRNHRLLLTGVWVPAVIAAAMAWTLSVPAASGLMTRWGSGEQLRQIATAAEALDLGNAAVASADRWQRSAILCFYLGCQYYGQPVSDDGIPLVDELEAATIDMFLVWDPQQPSPPGIDGPPVRLGGLRVYPLSEVQETE